MQVRQQGGLARTLESFSVNICCLSEMLQDISFKIRLTFPLNSNTKLHLWSEEERTSSKPQVWPRFLSIGKRGQSSDTADHQLFLASTRFRQSKRCIATWHPLDHAQEWSPLDNLAISYGWPDSLLHGGSYWSTYLDCDHPLVCAAICLRIGGTKHFGPTYLNTNNLRDPLVLEAYRTMLSQILGSVTPSNMDAHWEHPKQAILKPGMTTCGTVRHFRSS